MSALLSKGDIAERGLHTQCIFVPRSQPNNEQIRADPLQLSKLRGKISYWFDDAPRDKQDYRAGCLRCGAAAGG